MNIWRRTSPNRRDVKIITWQGRCEVHERFTAADIRGYREANPGVVVLAHPECSPDVVAEADFAGSTSAMIDYVRQAAAARGWCWSPNAP